MEPKTPTSDTSVVRACIESLERLAAALDVADPAQQPCWVDPSGSRALQRCLVHQAFTVPGDGAHAVCPVSGRAVTAMPGRVATAAELVADIDEATALLQAVRVRAAAGAAREAKEASDPIARFIKDGFGGRVIVKGGSTS